MSAAPSKTGRSSAEPAILVETWIAIALPIAATVVAVALGSVYLLAS